MKPLLPILLLISLPALAAPLPDQTTLKGRVVDWPAGQTGELRLQSDVNATRLNEVFATGSVDAQGNFELKLPPREQVTATLAPVARLFASPAAIGNGECIGEGSTSPSAGGFRGFNLIALLNGQETGDVRLRSSAGRFDEPGEVTADLWYFSEPAVLEGRVTCPNSIDDFATTVAGGWTLLPARTVSREERLLQQYRSPALPTGLQWRLYEEFGGTGMRFSPAPDGQGVVVEAVASGMPAEQAGLRPGDQIVVVDGQDLKGLPVTRVVNLIAGRPDTKLVLDVRREGQVRRVELTRAHVRLP